MWNHFFLLEEYTGTDYQYVGKLHSDQDRGDGSVKYVLNGDGAGSLFLIDENSGDIHATKRLDREEKAYYTLRAQAVNKRTGRPLEPESEFIIKIHDINDNEPKFTKETYIASVPEMSDVGTFVVQVTAMDADDATYGNSAKLVYSILQGQPYFSVEPETGKIFSLYNHFFCIPPETVNETVILSHSARFIKKIYQISLAHQLGTGLHQSDSFGEDGTEKRPNSLDFCYEMSGERGLYEPGPTGISKRWHGLTSVINQDPSNRTLGAETEIQSQELRNQSPIDLTDYKEQRTVFLFLSLSPEPETLCHSSTSSSVARTGTRNQPMVFKPVLEYPLPCCFLFRGFNCLIEFLIDIKQYTIQLSNLKPAGQWVLQDRTGQTPHSVFQLFLQGSYHLTTSESAEIGSAIGRIKANDADVGENADIQYSIIGGDGQDMFNIVTDRTTQEGVITVKKQLDFENKRMYTLKVEATNTHLDHRFLHLGPFKDTATVKITLQDVDESPVFSRSSYIIEVHEDTIPGSLIGAVTAWDPDAANHPVRYSIDRHTDLDRLFNVDSGNGSISTLQPLDREMAKWQNISIVATEITIQYSGLQTCIASVANLLYPTERGDLYNPRQTSRVPVFIKVLDVNDNAPEFAMFYETFVCENVKAGQLIQTISAVDTDEPLIGHKFAFSLSTPNPNFTIFDNEDNTARILTRRSGFSRREMSAYLLPVVISDNDYPIQSSTSTLTIRVCACDSRGNMQSCNAEALMLPAGLSTGALVAILLCIIILLSEYLLAFLNFDFFTSSHTHITIHPKTWHHERSAAFEICLHLNIFLVVIVVLFAALRRQKKKEPLIISKEDVRDNIVSYNDEGGGEEDTQAFDIGTLRNPEVMDANKLRRDIIPEMLFPFRRTSPIKDNADVRDFINSRLQENDTDPTAPPYDSLATYAYEGNGSIAESLSSLESAATDGDQDYDYLSNWGPQFKKLADMYIGKDTDKDT
ncbi:CADH6 protein, partial [Amia calva]|nr:CADH6 protein [Amia calva]